MLAGEPALPRAFVAPVLRELRELPAAEPHPARDGEGAGELSSREAEVLRLLRAGMRTAEIGRSLSLSPITVRRHISAGRGQAGRGRSSGGDRRDHSRPTRTAWTAACTRLCTPSFSKMFFT